MVTFVYLMETTFGEWLQKELTAQRITQADLSRLSGITTAQISRLISESRGIGVSAANAIAIALNIPPQEVFRAAGLLPPQPQEDPLVNLITYLSEQLPTDEDKQDAAEYIRLRLRLGLQETARQIRQIMAAIKDAGHSQALLAELQQLEKSQADQQARLAQAEADATALKLDISPGELEQALVVLKKTLRSSPAERVIVLRGIVVSVHAERIGGSPLRHRKGTIIGTVRLRLPLLADENILDVSLGE